MASKHDLMSALRCSGVVVVLRTETANDLVEVAKAVHAGGIKFIEITLTVPGALEVIRDAVQQLTGLEVYVGAGTVLDAQSARAAILAGASFVVSPIFDQPTVDLCRGYGVTVMPAGLTPGEIYQAWKGGADVVKVFPAKSMGGADYIKAIKEPLPQVELVPTNGVDFETAAGFIKAGALAVGLGSAIVSKALLAARDFEAITANARRMIELIAAAKSGVPG